MTEEVTCRIPGAGSRLQGFEFNADYSGDGTTVNDVLVTVLPFVVVAICILGALWIYHHHEWLADRLRRGVQD